MTALGELIRRYPQTNYAADARLKLDLVRELCHEGGTGPLTSRKQARAAG